MYVKRFKKDHIIEISEMYVSQNKIGNYELIGEGYVYPGANGKFTQNDYVLLSDENFELMQTALLVICEAMNKGANCVNLDDVYDEAVEIMEDIPYNEI